MSLVGYYSLSGKCMLRFNTTNAGSIKEAYDSMPGRFKMLTLLHVLFY
jgi:hypothetical protein